MATGMAKLSSSGTGMPEEVLSHIFEPFYSTKGEKGTGLGLSHLYGFVKRSMGAITVESKVGKGTEFMIYFPVNKDGLITKGETEAPQIHTGTLRNETILVVDDEDQLRDVLFEKLSRQGYNVLCASNGEEALEVLSSVKVSLVLSDIVMPVMDGVALANQVQEKYPEVKIQLMSGFSDEMQSKLNNPSLYSERLLKPFKFSQLISAVKMLLDFETN